MPASSASLHVFSVLLTLLLSTLIFSTGCATGEEAAQDVQKEAASGCPAEAEGFKEAWPRIEKDQRERPTHKALAYAKSTESVCFAYGYSEDYDSRQETAEQAMSNCRKFRREVMEEINESLSERTLHSVDGERQ